MALFVHKISFNCQADDYREGVESGKMLIIMKRFITLFTVAALSFALVPATTYAAKPTSPTKTTELVGYDISYPQCGAKLPTDQYFGIVGVNGGLATTTNPCLASQLTWANQSKSGSTQSKVQLYVNTANPYGVAGITTWPTSNIDQTGQTTNNSYGTCVGANDTACSWQYGWNRAIADNLDRFIPAAQAASINSSASAYTWWLDVETGNSWQAPSLESPNAYANNVATLEGMTAYFKSQNVQVGLYSTAPQWSQITGNAIPANSNLNGLANWRPSGTSLNIAISNCSVAPLTTGGYISMTQYVQRSLDKNHSCI